MLLKRVPLILLALVLLVSFAACTGKTLTDKQRLLQAREAYNQLLQEYLLLKDQVDLEDQTRAKAIFIQMDRSLKLWKTALNEGEEWDIYSEDFIRLKNDLINTIGEVMGWTQK